MKFLQEQEMPDKAKIEIKFMLISLQHAEKIFILHWLSLQWEINSETDADNSQVLLIAAQSIGTTHGHVKPSTL